MNSPLTLRAVGPALLVGLLAFALTVEWREQSRAAGELADRRAELARAVEQRQAHTATLERRLSELRAALAQVGARTGGKELREVRALADRIAGLSGTTPATGPGLVVELADAPGARPGDAEPDFRIQDVDIQAVVNALWNAGAEAIAVDGQRVVSTTAIRNAGAAVLVNYRVLASPYRIEALGHPGILHDRFNGSSIAARFRNWGTVYGLGFKVSVQETIELPAFTGSLRFKYARPIEEEG